MQQCGQRFLYDQSGNGVVANGLTNGQTSEEDASANLPEGWEKRIDPNGRVYYVNHKNKVFIKTFLLYCSTKN